MVKNQLRNVHKIKDEIKLILLFSLALDETYAVFKISFARIPHALGTGHIPCWGIFLSMQCDSEGNPHNLFDSL